MVLELLEQSQNNKKQYFLHPVLIVKGLHID